MLTQAAGCKSRLTAMRLPRARLGCVTLGAVIGAGAALPLPKDLVNIC